MLGIFLATAIQMSLGETIIGWFEEIVDAFIGMITAIPKAVADIFAGWADSILGEGWYGPILAAIVVVIVFLVVYGAIWLQGVIFE